MSYDWSLLATLGTLTDTGYQLREEVSHEDWLRVGVTLKRTGKGAMWWVGDWLRFGERQWGERYKEAMDATGHAYQTLANAAWVAREFADFSLRKEKLSWSHHHLLASTPEPERTRLAEQAEAEGWSCARLRQETNRSANAPELRVVETNPGYTVADLYALTRLGQSFGTVYADPPWPYGNQATRAATANHYGVMSMEDIYTLPIPDLVEDNAHLHLWTTTSFLAEGLRVIEAWGFTYKSHFIWAKPEMGLGNYWRVSHEILLLGVRGKAPFKDHGLKSWFTCSRGDTHSTKPDEVRKMIERASPGPYLELFGRRTAENWTVWGNQIERGTLFDREVREVA